MNVCVCVCLCLDGDGFGIGGCWVYCKNQATLISSSRTYRGGRQHEHHVAVAGGERVGVAVRGLVRLVPAPAEAHAQRDKEDEEEDEGDAPQEALGELGGGGAAHDPGVEVCGERDVADVHEQLRENEEESAVVLHAHALVPVRGHAQAPRQPHDVVDQVEERDHQHLWSGRVEAGV